MPNIQTFISPIFLDGIQLGDKTVIVADILRATSTIHHALHSGVTEIAPILLDDVDQYKDKNYLMVGEKAGQLLDGFDILNSPSYFKDRQLAPSKMCFCTTNGTKAIRAAKDAALTLMGSFLNFNFLAQYLLDEIKTDVVIVCSGWQGNMSYEDFFFAGKLIHLLENKFTPSGDSSLLAHSSFKNLNGDVIEHLRKLAFAQQLSGYNSEEDIRAALMEDHAEILPVYRDNLIVDLKKGNQ